MNPPLRLLPLTLLVVACQQSSGGLSPVATGPGALDVLPIIRLDPSQPVLSWTSGYVTPTQSVITNDADWVAAWDMIHQQLMPVPQIPPVDFNQSMVVLAAMGKKPTGGYLITIDSASVTTGGELDISVRESSPGAGCVSVTMETSPVDAVIIPRRTEPAVFQVHATRQDCQ